MPGHRSSSGSVKSLAGYISPDRTRAGRGRGFRSWHLNVRTCLFVALSVSCVMLYCSRMWFASLSCVAAAMAALLPAVKTSDMGQAGQSSLTPFRLQPLPLGVIHPKGWIRDQLQLMADGQAGHQYEFYNFVASSPWLGGDKDYSPLREAFPYWFNGIVPLAYSLQDERLKRQISSSVDHVLTNQSSDGWLGPESKDSGLRNLWARFPFLLGLTRLVEADPSYSPSVLPALRKFVGLAHDMLANNGTGLLRQQNGDALSEMDHGWGRARVADFLISLQWLFENDDQADHAMLLDTMRMAKNGALEWHEWYTDANYTKGDLNQEPQETTDLKFPFLHGVNVGQGLKAGAVYNRFDPSEAHTALARRAVDWTFLYHGASSGSILADERLQGLHPYYGSELCTTVETMHSLTYLYHALGDATFAERAELAAFNALPAAATGDWWAHQYITQPNQPYSTHIPDGPFWNVKGNGQTYGQEPNYPCCTVNHPQGYPKFVAASWVKVGNDGLGHAFLIPSALETTLDNGVTVNVDVATNYPFADALFYRISSSGPFKLHVRIPSWVVESSLFVQANGARSQSRATDSHTGMIEVSLPSGDSRVDVSFLRVVRTVARPKGNAFSVMHGPLLYSLDVGYLAESHRPRDFGDGGPLFGKTKLPALAQDWTITNTKTWRMAIDKHSLVQKSKANIWTMDLQSPIWGRDAPPTYIEGNGCEIEWPLYRSVPGPVPTRKRCIGNQTRVRFIPFGSAKIGMSELPVLF